MDNQAGIADQPTDSAPTPGTAMRRTVSASTWRAFAIWTAIFWGATGGLGLLFFAGVLDFSTSTKTSLYGTSIWLNGCLIPLLLPGAKQRPKLDVLHDCLVIWLVSYTMKDRPFSRSTRTVAARVHQEGRPLQLELVLLEF